jgi:hypothetical protein
MNTALLLVQTVGAMPTLARPGFLPAVRRTRAAMTARTQ